MDKIVEDIKNTLNWVWLMAIIIMLTTCSTHSHINKLSNKIEQLEQEVRNVERGNKTAG